MLTGLSHTHIRDRIEAAREIARTLKFTHRITHEFIADALKFVKSMPDGASVIKAAKSVAFAMPSECFIQVKIRVGESDFLLPKFYDLALAKDSTYFERMLAPGFGDEKKFPDLNVEAFKSFLGRIYGGDESEPSFEELVECLRIAYEYEFSGYCSIILIDVICFIKQASLAQIPILYSLAREIDESCLIKSLDCAKKFDLSRPFSTGCFVSNPEQLEAALERNPDINVLEIEYVPFSLKNLIDTLKRFKHLKHVLVNNTNDPCETIYTYNPVKECSFNVSFITAMSSSSMLMRRVISEFDNFKAIRVMTINKYHVMHPESPFNSKVPHEHIPEVVRVLNQYVNLILRGVHLYELTVIPNTLPCDKLYQAFFNTH
ncbi:MAG: hypothetical protein ACK4HV_02480, partial [Parachlamydiaceae bacterium]